jgi:hypothetical protein
MSGPVLRRAKQLERPAGPTSLSMRAVEDLEHPINANVGSPPITKPVTQRGQPRIPAKAGRTPSSPPALIILETRRPSTVHYRPTHSVNAGRANGCGRAAMAICPRSSDCRLRARIAPYAVSPSPTRAA